MKIVFWGSSDFSMPSLKKLFDSHEVVAIVTNPDRRFGRGMKQLHQTPVKEFALEHGVFVLQPTLIRTDEFYEELKHLRADIFVVVSYGKIIPERIIYLPPYHSINLHASLLPKYRGASPIQEALKNGDALTGNTVQFITKELDKGPILLQETIEIHESERAAELSRKLADRGAELLLRALYKIEAEETETCEQSESECSYCGIIERGDGNFCFETETAEQILNKFRAYYAWPGIYTLFHPVSKEAEPLKVTISEIEILSDTQGAPGVVLQADKEALTVATPMGAVKLLRLKPAGKKDMDYIAFNNGYKPKVGQHF